MFCPEHEDYIVFYVCGHSRCAHSDARNLNTTIVEGPIERHKSRLASRETGDGLTGTYSGESLDRTESVPKRSRERRARASCSQSLTASSVVPCPRSLPKLIAFDFAIIVWILVLSTIYSSSNIP